MATHFNISPSSFYKHIPHGPSISTVRTDNNPSSRWSQSGVSVVRDL